MKRILQCLITSVFILCVSSASAVQLSNLKIGQQANGTRFVFDASGPINFHSFTLSNPDRLVIDILQGRFSQVVSVSTLKDTPVNDLRSGEYRDGRLRLVFDLSAKVNASVVLVKPQGDKPYRLVIDLKNSKFSVVVPQPNPFVPTRPVITADQSSSRPSNVIVVIDPGHGGKDPGATGLRGTHEKDVVLAISKQLQQIINNTPGFTAKLTRSGDYYLTLRQRLAIARQYKADMFVAIHADAYPNTSATGTSVYALSQRGATSEAARWLAQRENASELMGGVDLSDKSHLLKSVLIDLSQTATVRTSLRIGGQIIQFLSRITALHHRQVEQAAFVVLKSPDIPSLLVETGFLSNPYEENRLRSGRYQQNLAVSIAGGIQDYFQSSPPPGTLLAMQRARYARNT